MTYKHLTLAALIISTAISAASDCECETKVTATTSVPTIESSYIREELQTPIYGQFGFLNNGVTTEEIQALCQRFHRYFPDITFSYVDNRTEVNAVAFGDGVTFPRTVELWGGMGRHPAMKLEGLAIILAHEVGHHYGNTDKVITNPTGDSQDKTYPHGAYCEDQSDYWGTRVGLRIVYNDLAEFTNDHQNGNNGYSDWTRLDAMDSDEYAAKVQVGIDQAYSLLSGGLFAPADAFLLAEHRNQSSSFTSSGCGHPRAACRRQLYESGLLKEPRSTCNDASDLSSTPSANSLYLLKKYGHMFGHGTRHTHVTKSSEDSSEQNLSELLEAIKMLQTEVADIKSKLK